jgi:hypothetical protein
MQNSSPQVSALMVFLSSDGRAMTKRYYLRRQKYPSMGEVLSGEAQQRAARIPLSY